MPDEPRVQELLAELLDRQATPAEVCGACPELLPVVRERWRQICQLRAEFDALLPVCSHGALPMMPQASPLVQTPTAPGGEGPGTVIGPYKLLERIAEGGMGAVWMAQQTEPVKRLVAVKLIKAGMDSRQVIARFEAERQALALMDHPNIARALDAGTTGAGRPYFVMDLVKGVPITKYCDEHHLTLRQRLALFIPVCQAVQHAHQKGIIHRDLKPSNVLIALYDDKPVPKVIDFGVAKATGKQLTEATLHTGFGAVVGTLEYMSPEQAGFNQLDIDTRSDIYSLGVLVYELLAGSPPFTRKELEKAGTLEMLRVIREQEPSKPSAKLSTAEGLPTLAANRGTEPAKLTRLVRGELDWIVMKALEKDRSRRYETANGFAMDVERYLADEPVRACPPSLGYRLRKFVRRHKPQVAAAALLLFVLLAGLAFVLWHNRELDGKNRDLLAANEAEKKAKETAEQREAETKAVLQFVENKVFAAARPKNQQGGLGYDVQLADAVTSALPYVETSFPQQPLIEARLRLTLGTSFWHLGKAKIAIDQCQRACELYSRHCGRDHPDTLNSMNNLANSYSDAGRTQEALKLREETLQLRKARLGPDHPDTLKSMNNLAISYADAGRTQEALKLREETLQLQKAKLGPDHADALASMVNLGHSYLALGRRSDAIKVYEQALPIMKAKMPDHQFTFNCMNNLAVCYADAGRTQEALKLREKTLELQKAKFGPDHPDTLMSMNNLALSYADAGRTQEALKLSEKTLQLRKAKLGPDHPETLRSMNDVANSYAGLGRYAEAFKLHEETLGLRKSKLGPDHPDTLVSMNNLAYSYADAGRTQEALKLREETLQLRKARLGRDHPDTLKSMNNLAISYAAAGRTQEALELREETLQLRKAKLGPDHPDTLLSMNNLAISYDAAGRAQEALKLREETLQLQRAKLGPDHPDTLLSMNNLAWTLATAQDPKLRDPARAVELGKELVAYTPKSGNAWNTLGVAQYRARDWRAAITALEKSMDFREGGSGSDWFFLAMSHGKLGDKDQARKWYDKAVAWLDKNKPKDAELTRFRAEAEQLLGIKRKTPTTEPPKTQK
jgi:eukaryotic-like serine/threonine-protein kinase